MSELFAKLIETLGTLCLASGGRDGHFERSLVGESVRVVEGCRNSCVDVG